MKTSKPEQKKEQAAESEKTEKADANSERTENIVALAVFGLLILIGIFIFTRGFGLMDNGVDPSDRINVPIGNSPFKGSPNASVVIIAFSDFECPNCRVGEERINALLEKYPDNLVYVFKNYPLTMTHKYSLNASLAAACADEQGKFWEYSELLFQHQNQLETAYLRDYASQLGLNKTRFDECLVTQKYKADIDADIKAANNAGVSGTPTFFIDGIRIVGAQSEDVFTKIIDSEIRLRK
jgi:protein-disulfide isomerase